VVGALRSLLGPAPFYDHSFVHIVPAHSEAAQQWHADSVIDVRPLRFDLLVLYYPQDTPDEMGPTLVLPGSHLRKVRFGSISHYRNIVGQRRLACSAGTIVLTHSDLWHCAQPNSTERPRYMFKLRLEPSGGQRGWSGTDGRDDPDLLERIYRSNQHWHGAEHREEQIQRAKFWRYLVGDDTIDAAGGQLTRFGI
jgi:ectoine hydroxylase-related dioxygenase (phytanoyl-CoA dioxygenase family)